MCLKDIEIFTATIDRGPFKHLKEFGGTASSDQILEKEPGFDDIFSCAVYQAYLDMCRTVSGAGKGSKKKQIEAAQNQAVQELRNYFASKPRANSEAFDSWANSALCNIQLQGKLTIGQAQKILNMAFKYLFCCEDFRKDKSEYFAYCHMPLDDYTLTWYKQECSPSWKRVAWSAIDDISDYSDIQKNIRQRLSGNQVLIAEFGIWEKEKQRRRRDELKKSISMILSSPECNDELRHLLEILNSELQ